MKELSTQKPLFSKRISTRKAIIFVVSLVFSLPGCAVINPYESDFSCPETFHGKCISVQGAYDESLSGKDDSYESAIDNCIGGKCPERAVRSR